MDLYMHIIMLGALLTFVSGGYLPDRARLAAWIRRRRNAMGNAENPQGLLDNEEYYRRPYYYAVEDNEGDGGGESVAPVKPVKIHFPNKKLVESAKERPRVYPVNSIPSTSANNNVARSSTNFALPVENEVKNNVRRMFVPDPEEPSSAPAVKPSKQSYKYLNPSSTFQDRRDDLEHYASPKYHFKYAVNDLEHYDIKHHEEERDGDHTVGEYSVLQPDGSVLTVKYTVRGDEGFNAVVTKTDVPKDIDYHQYSIDRHEPRNEYYQEGF